MDLPSRRPASLPHGTSAVNTLPHRHPGVTRRELLQVGCSGLLGLGLSSVVPVAAASPRRAKSVIVVFLTGAPSHIDTFDPKPDTPAEIRGEFATIQTKTPGLLATEHVVKLAARSDKYAVVRTLSHKDNNHTAATHHLITGANQPGVRFDKPLSRDDFPCYGAGVSYLRPSAPGVPAGVTLPTFLAEGPLVWPGQHGGFLGPKHDPWQITKDPNAAGFGVDNLRLADGLQVDQLRDRVALLESVNRQRVALDQSAEGKRLTDQQGQAVAVLTSGAVARAFDLASEPASLRDRYGRHMFGQSLLLSRRLVEAGVPVVQVNLGRVQNWDSHGTIFPRLKKDLLPPTDTGVAALLDDLHDRGLLDSTLVVMLGEFGRTPKVVGTGRDHWAPCFFGLFAGGGVRGGQVIGKSDKAGAYPATTPYSPDDVGATIYHALGLDPASEVVDRLGRPVTLNRGTPIQALYS
ncbi:MAG: DUF1501 domain-containing protein [Gemmataceae bacterium]|nr:DUF1501 domain-containing protein [Gemmataceae bacterium]